MSRYMGVLEMSNARAQAEFWFIFNLMETQIRRY